MNIPNIKSKWIYLVGAAGILLIILSLILPVKSESNGETAEFYSKQLEEKIASLLSDVKGAGKVSVLLTLDCGGESVLAENSETSGEKRATDILVINGKSGDEPVKLKEIFPKVRGVAVVCDGGDNVDVKNKITELLSSALGIPTNRITVCG